jgi:hypothetical protein
VVEGADCALNRFRGVSRSKQRIRGVQEASPVPPPSTTLPSRLHSLLLQRLPQHQQFLQRSDASSSRASLVPLSYASPTAFLELSRFSSLSRKLNNSRGRLSSSSFYPLHSIASL